MTTATRTLPRSILLLTVLGIAAGAVAVTGSPLFTGFDDNPAAGAVQEDTMFTGFDDNPAAAAVDAVPRYMREEPRIQQRTRVAANATTTGNTSAQQQTNTTINDTVDYTLNRDFDNVYITQDARSDIRQECRVTGSCAQAADSRIDQDANVRIDGRHSNVFVRQRADSTVDQDCTADDGCDQEADQDINQRTNFDTAQGSNGFTTRSGEARWRQQQNPSYTGMP